MRRLVVAGQLTSAAVVLALSGCDAPDPMSPTANVLLAASASRAPVESPFVTVIDDFNPCTGRPISLTFSGTAMIQAFADHFLMRVKGEVTTSDGFTGTFNWTFVEYGDQVGIVRAHDMELSDATGQRMIFPVGLEHETNVHGETVVSFVRFSKDAVRCVGRR